MATSLPERPVQRAMQSRRSIRKFAPTPVERAVVARLLEAGVQAPNHRLTRPWRFFVLDAAGPRRDELTRVAELIALRSAPEPHDEQARERARSRSAEIANVPVLILAYATPGRDAHETRENYAAVACALQNVQLAAVEEGLVGGWSTGAIVRDNAMRDAIGADPAWDFVGAVYLGYPAPGPQQDPRPRPPADDYTSWLS
jgi:nitroreductase